MARISILMGIYNCAPTLAEAIDSILEQKYSDWELILCDDGSKDETYTIANEYQKQYSDKIILLKNEKNQGLNYTLNKCLQHATGEYVARMDGDDISLPERFEKEIEFLDEHPEYAIISCANVYFDESGIWGRNYVIQKPEKKDFIKHSPFFCHASCMIRREAMVKVGGYTVDERMLRFEDVNLWYKLYAAGYKGYNLEEPLYKVRDDINATRRRSLKSRMNGVYVTFKGFQMLEFPWYTYRYVILDFVKHLLKGLIPEKLYIQIHKRKLGVK